MKIINGLISASIFLTVSCGCPDKNKVEEKHINIPKLTNKKVDKQVLPDTVAPSKAAPVVSKYKYNPAKDPANKGGFDLVKKRSPEDPGDASKKPFDIEALYKLKSIYSPVWSPDGKQILFTLASSDLAGGKRKTDIYKINADGSGLRRMTRNESADFSPVWSPDGKSFIFVSTRSGSAQIWKMDIDGGEPEQITRVYSGVSDPVWSPDGKQLAFSTTVFPEYGADDAKNKAAFEKMKKNPLQAHLADHLLYRHWTSYKDGTRTHIFVLNLDTKKVKDVTPGDFEAPSFSLGDLDYAFSPDGKELCYTSNHEQEDARAYTTNKDLFVVSLAEKGKTVNITAANKAYDGTPSYSPDGKYIAYRFQKQPGYEADRFRLAVYERKTGKIKVLTENFDNWVLDFKWSADSRSIYFMAPVKGRYPLFNVNVETGKINRVPGIPSLRSYDVSSDGKVAFTFTTVGTPVELFVRNNKGKIKRVSYFNKEVVENYDIRPVEEMWIPGAGGKKVHTFIVKPHGFKKGVKYPMVINVHGGPQMQWSDSLRGDWQIYPAFGYVVVFPNPHGSTGYGQAYTAAISKDWGGKVYEDVMAVTKAVAKLDYIDENRMAAMGWSYGGYMMDWLLGHTDMFKAIVSMMGVYDLNVEYGATEELWFPEWDLGGTPWDKPEIYKKWSPSTYAKNFKTPTLIITGEKDYRVPYTQSLQLFTALRRQNIPSRLIVFKNDGHWPNYVKSMPLYYASHLDWFAKYLKGKTCPYDIKKMVRENIFANGPVNKK